MSVCFTLSSCVVGEFTFGITLVSQNGTGTGEMDIEVRTVDGIPIGKINQRTLPDCLHS